MPDAVFVDGNRRCWRGLDEISAQVRAEAEETSYSSSRMTNCIIRVEPDCQEAWVTCYLHQPVTSDILPVHSSRFCRWTARLKLDRDVWRVADWTCQMDLETSYRTEDPEPLHDGTGTIQPAELVRSQRSAPVVDLDSGRSGWEVLHDDVWSAHHWLLDHRQQPKSSSSREERVCADYAIRELLADYAYAHDSRDLAWSSSVFADGGILNNETAIFDGNAQVVDAFRRWNANMRLSFHRFSNPIVVLVPDRPEA